MVAQDQCLRCLKQQRFRRHSLDPPAASDVNRRSFLCHFLPVIVPRTQNLLRMKLQHFLHHSLDRLPVVGHETSLRL